MKRITVLALGVILALAVAAPMAAAQNDLPSNIRNQAHSNILKELAAQWWNWAVLEPSPLDDDYESGPQCEGEFVDGVFFLAGTTGGRNAYLHRAGRYAAFLPRGERRVQRGSHGAHG